MRKLLTATWIGVARRPGVRVLCASPAALRDTDASRDRLAWLELLVFSGLMGAMLCAVHGAAWKLLGETAGMLLLPGLVTGAFMVAGPYRRAIGSVSRLLSPRDAAGRGVVSAAVVTTLCIGIAALEPDFYWWGGQWPNWLGALGPHPAKVYRILPLLPAWGAWAMLVTVQFCRPDDGTEPAVVAFARGCGPFAVAGGMAVLMAVTIQMLGFLPWCQLAVSAVGVLGAIVLGLLACFAGGGLRQRTLLAANVGTQIAVLLAYIAVRNLVAR
ncbi:MAG: hypothetical protein ACLFV7_00495 [Phycisphaerae bacterium]